MTHTEFRLRYVITLVFGLIVTTTPLIAEPPTQNATERVLRKDVVVQASRDAVWKYWTTRDGIRSFFGADAAIDLKIGGKFEVYMSLDAPEGKRGSEGCQILSFLPHEMLSFTWNFPPSIPQLRDHNQQTYVVLQFAALSNDQTWVRFEQHGWKDGEEWEAGYAYFDRAWSYVLTNLKKHFEEQTSAHDPKPTSIWFVENFDTPPSRVWHFLTTKAGLEHWAAPVVAVDFRVGGKILTNYHTDQGTDGPDTFETTILAYEPERMLATQARLPETVGALRVVKETQTIYHLKETGERGTTLIVVSCGWKTGGDWDVARTFFETNNPKKFAALRSAMEANALPEGTTRAPHESE
ncbi:MAG: SRPBCC domain-containing protein [Phycisphaerae bacterium]